MRKKEADVREKNKQREARAKAKEELNKNEQVKSYEQR